MNKSGGEYREGCHGSRDNGRVHRGKKAAGEAWPKGVLNLSLKVKVIKPLTVSLEDYPTQSVKPGQISQSWNGGGGLIYEWKDDERNSQACEYRGEHTFRSCVEQRHLRRALWMRRAEHPSDRFKDVMNTDLL